MELQLGGSGGGRLLEVFGDRPSINETFVLGDIEVLRYERGRMDFGV